MYQIQVTSDPIQTQTFKLFDMNLKVTLYFNKTANSWDMDLFDNDKGTYITQRKGLSVLSPALIERRLPFVVTLYPRDNKGIQPQSKADLIEKFDIYFLTKSDFFDLI